MKPKDIIEEAEQVTEQTRDEFRGFVQGIGYALATLNRMHDEPTMCGHVLKESGLALRDFMVCDEYDRSEIRRIWRSEKRRIGR